MKYEQYNIYVPYIVVVAKTNDVITEHLLGNNQQLISLFRVERANFEHSVAKNNLIFVSIHNWNTCGVTGTMAGHSQIIGHHIHAIISLSKRFCLAFTMSSCKKLIKLGGKKLVYNFKSVNVLKWDEKNKPLFWEIPCIDGNFFHAIFLAPNCWRCLCYWRKNHHGV